MKKKRKKVKKRAAQTTTVTAAADQDVVVLLTTLVQKLTSFEAKLDTVLSRISAQQFSPSKPQPIPARQPQERSAGRVGHGECTQDDDLHVRSAPDQRRARRERLAPVSAVLPLRAGEQVVIGVGLRGNARQSPRQHEATGKQSVEQHHLIHSTSSLGTGHVIPGR